MLSASTEQAARGIAGDNHRYYSMRRIHLHVRLIGSDHETFNRLTGHKSIHNLPDVRDSDASIEKMIGFD